MNKLSSNLKKIRKDNSLSQEALAEKLGVSRQAISKWESGLAYPEMEKIIEISNMFDTNIDDLLNRDIRDVISESEGKTNINKQMNQIFNNITKSFDMFRDMNIKSKIKCLLENGLLALLSIIFFIVVAGIFTFVYDRIFGFLNYKIYYVILNIFEGIYILFAFVVTLYIVLHFFKIRYLDYYDKKDIINDINESEEELDIKEDKVNINLKKEKVIIRDPKHSSYSFMNSILKVIIFIFKTCLFIGTIVFILLLLLSVSASICSFLFIKNILLFISLLLLSVSVSSTLVIIILYLLNYIFNRKNNNKATIISFIISIIGIGVSFGLLFISSLNMNIIDINDNSYIEEKTMNIDMNKDLLFDMEINYVVKDIPNIEIVYNLNKYYSLNEYYNYISTEKEYFKLFGFYSNINNPFKLVKEQIKLINNNIINPMYEKFYIVTVYANQENINILKSNYNKYHNN